jgi:hypothetical protein
MTPSRKQIWATFLDWGRVPCSLILIGVTAYVYFYWHTVTILEYRHTVGLKVEELHPAGSDVVRISGRAFHSALAVKKITCERDGSSIAVFVHLFVTRGGRTGSFVYDVPVPASVTEVRFGPERAVIWRRPAPIATAESHAHDAQSLSPVQF